MTHLLWKSFWEDDVDRFRRLLSPAAHGAQSVARPSLGSPGGGSPGGLGTSPRPSARARKTPGPGTNLGNARHGNTGYGKTEVNSRDYAGLTLLLRAASLTTENALAFVEALLAHPAIDIYAQDPESGWNALHRALYAGNTSIARLLLEKERNDLTGHTASVSRVGQLIKTKDHEGNSPFDLYNSTIGERNLKDLVERQEVSDDSDSEEDGSVRGGVPKGAPLGGLGEDLYAFGSNRNLSLGFNDEDDRQFPERVYIKRPDHLLVRFYNEYLEKAGLEGSAPQDIAKIPTLVLNRPLVVQDVVLSRLHSAVLTTDPVSNLYVCGIGRGGRLGLGDENTRFTYTAVQGPLADKNVTQVALGHNHTMAIDDTGALWTWGNNANGQLGYALPEPAKKDEDPISTVPRQVFGPLKKEIIVGVAASSIHSVAHTGTSLFCWGKNVGQLALMDADSRSLEFQQTPRKVAASLFSSPIVMATAIDKATAILLQNHVVCIFTGYGYHIVKFPPTYYNPFGPSMAPARSEFTNASYITSGGETIAALTSNGDLFTMNLDHKIETGSSSTSTTNPSKLKGAVTPPQCLWRAKKDGVQSVGVDEYGSVIISTHSGAVWRRVERTKGRDESKRKDFKFQRVPFITRVSAVRASFGTFAAVRQDSSVMRDHPAVEDQALWDDVTELNCLRGFEASSPARQNEKERLYWETDAVQAKLGRLSPVAREVLKSAELEEDLRQHLTTWSYSNDQLDTAVCTSSEPDLIVPIHGWLLAARSSVLRKVLAQFRRTGSVELAETFTVSDMDGKTVVTFHGLDSVSILNLVLFMYEDKVIPVWDFTRHAPAMAYRCRQIRLEVMRLASRLNMHSLEAAARLHAPPRKCMDEDFRLAIKDRSFFDDTDAILELDDAEVPVHSSFLCQRCPWFEGLFHGRSGGAWLAGRRGAEGADKIRIDLEHMDPEAFKYVLRYLYGDFGSELFDPTICDSLDDFFDLVMEVMSISDYLMIDRLSQICQKTMGKFANIRNIAHLLNAISPCSVTEFKDASLEYVCLQLESMLENHLLDELDEELFLELDEVVRANQTAQLPFARSGRAELLLHETYPELAQDIDEERQVRVREMAYKAQKEDERRVLYVARTKFGSLDDTSPATPTPDRTRKISKAGRNAPFSPNLKPRKSQADLMFDMDEEDASPLNSPLARPRKRGDAAPDLDQSSSLGVSWQDTAAKAGTSVETSLPRTPVALRIGESTREDASPQGMSPLQAKGPWRQASISTSKLDLRDIIQSEDTRRSALSAGLAAEKAQEIAPKLAPPKMSQKEKKRQQQQQAQAAQATMLDSRTPKKAWDTSAGESSASPWKVATGKNRISSSNTLSTDNTPALPTSVPLHRRTASPDTRFAGQRTPSSSTAPNRPTAKPAAPAPSGSAPKPATEPARPLVPHSKTYLTPAPKAEPLLGVSMADIIGEQKRDKESVREAVAKRSLQEIQQEQAFQEWWDAESRRTQEEEARRVAREREREEKDSKKGGGRRGRGGKPKGLAGESSVRSGAASGSGAAEGSKSGAGSGTGFRGRGKGKGKGPRDATPAAGAANGGRA
ncbi:hypothetical protein OQA88_10025 [Cercophora sp. LCS_1]